MYFSYSTLTASNKTSPALSILRSVALFLSGISLWSFSTTDACELRTPVMRRMSVVLFFKGKSFRLKKKKKSSLVLLYYSPTCLVLLPLNCSLHLRKKGVHVEFQVFRVDWRSDSSLEFRHNSFLVPLIITYNLLHGGWISK